MANNSKDNSAAMTGVALIIACLGIFLAIVFAIFIFIAFVFSVLSLMALWRPVQLGRFEITREEGKAYLVRGYIGAFLFGFFVIFCEVVFGVRVRSDYLPHIIAAGYALGSLGIEVLYALEGAEAAKAAPSAQNMPTILPPAARPASFEYEPPPAPQVPFRFASWDDEEELRK